MENADLAWQIPVIFVLLAASSMFSGLVIGYLGLDTAYLEILMQQPQVDKASKVQADYANRIYPLRKKGNLLLATMVLGNTASNALLSILLADFTSGLIGFLLSTILILIFAEVLPQAICARYGLKISAKITWLTQIIVVAFLPFTYLFVWALDKLLGKDIGTKFTLEQIKTLFAIYEHEARINHAQMKILSSTIDFPTKTVGDIMTPLEDAYMLDAAEALTIEKLQEIYSQGFSRIPVYESSRKNLIGLLIAKDLMFLSPSKVENLWRLKDIFLRKIQLIDQSTSVNDLFELIKLSRSHLAIAIKASEKSDMSPCFEPVGLITLEDILETLLQEKIHDEHDYVAGEVKTRQQSSIKSTIIFSEFSTAEALSENEMLAITDYLRTRVGPFQNMSLSSLAGVISKAKVRFFKGGGDSDDETENSLYRCGVESKHFTLILSGSVNLNIPEEQISLTLGAFSHLGLKCLQYPKADYIPNFSAVAMGNTRVLRVSQRMFNSYS
mmetsp:Transcript_27327/g.49156  ORF Transcript_27327/g.49156 Transcript_27327/m.49156 type:complete len:499 (-) Transcript_27327:226-1722(-)